MAIHPTAVVAKGVSLAEDVSVGPFAVLEDGVVIGAGTTVGAHAVLKSGLRLGERVAVHEGAVLGGTPQDRKFSGAESFVEVGDDCVIRECATIHRSAVAGGVTKVGARCYLMGYGHIAHDCSIEDDVVIASYVALAGHVRIGRKAFVSGGVAIHQFTRIGTLAMIGGGSKVNRDVPPFVLVDGVPAGAVGLNQVGLHRAGFADEEVRALKRAFRTVFREKRPLSEALEQLGRDESESVGELASFLRTSERGVCRPRRR